jgi:hypothetical protein
MSMYGINGEPFVNLSEYVDLTDFDKLHPTICRNFIEAKEHMYVGTFYAPEDFLRMDAYDKNLKSLLSAHYEFMGLPDDDPIKINGSDLSPNDLATYLKFALKGYDPYSFFLLYDYKENWRDDPSVDGTLESGKYFPELLSWVHSLKDKGIFSHIGRVVLFLVDHGGIRIQHSHHGYPLPDPYYPSSSEDIVEFMLIQKSSDAKTFFVSDSEHNKFYFDSRVTWFNDKDWHGGDPLLYSSYSLRIDGVFTDDLKNKICR